jgi:A/G-specific adenine glycosylase
MSRELEGSRLSPEEIDCFRREIYDSYVRYGRDLPWRRTTNGYHIFVSEVMLQQTQVGRVRGKYEVFIDTFPTFSSLAGASLKDVLTVWQGLGYNRRALALLEAARLITSRYGNELPRTVEGLSSLPGIGKATASAILAFWLGTPVVFIETNIRRTFIGYFFHGNEAVRDAHIASFVEQTLDRRDPRNWYYALMDYGALRGKGPENANRKSAHYRRQTPFEGSDRKIRGAVLGLLLEGPHVSAREIEERTGADGARVLAILTRMQEEGLVKEEGTGYTIP